MADAAVSHPGCRGRGGRDRLGRVGGLDSGANPPARRRREESGPGRRSSKGGRAGDEPGRSGLAETGSPPGGGGQVGECPGRSRGGFTTKIHLAAEGRCRPLAFVLTPGHYGDGPQLEWVLEQVSVPRTGVGRPRTRPGHVLADKAYTSRRNRLYLRRRGIRHTIPERLDQRRKGTGVPAKRRVPRCIQFVLAPELLRIRRIASTTNEAEPTAKMLASTVSCWMARATTRVAVTVAATTSAVNARRCLALSVGCLNTGVSRWSGGWECSWTQSVSRQRRRSCTCLEPPCIRRHKPEVPEVSNDRRDGVLPGPGGSI